MLNVQAATKSCCFESEMKIKNINNLKLKNWHISGVAMSIVSKQNWNLDLSELVFVETAKIKKLVKILIARTRTNNNLSPGMMPNPELKPRTH